MIPTIFINCKEYPFVEWILSGKKKYETRNSNTLGRFIGERVLVAETGNGRPRVKCSAVISEAIEIHSWRDWRTYVSDDDVPLLSSYDWQPDTKRKIIYKLSDVKYIVPFVPEGRRHGRTWMECDNYPAGNTAKEEEVTEETRFAGRTGQSIVIHRYAQDDYSVWFTDNPNDDTSGCSVRGTMLDMLEEIAGEIPARKVTNDTERLETIGCFIDIFEDFLEDHGIDIPNEEKEQSEGPCIIYGTHYGELSDRIEHLLMCLNVL